MDWVESAAVTPPRDQGPSPTCWAYSGVAAIESMNKIKRGQLVNLTVVDVIIDNIRFWMDGAWPDVVFHDGVKQGIRKLKRKDVCFFVFVFKIYLSNIYIYIFIYRGGKDR